jgi:hypothetical protein
MEENDPQGRPVVKTGWTAGSDAGRGAAAGRGAGSVLAWFAGVAALLGGCMEPRDVAMDPMLLDTAFVATEPDTVLMMETILIEGMPERLLVRPFESPVDFPLGFSTVVPADMVVDFVSSGEGDAVRFEAVFGGIHRSDAMLGLIVPPNRPDAEEAREMVAGVASDLGGVQVSDPVFPGAIAGYRLVGEVAGFLALGQQNDQWFYFLAQYPPEFGDGMAPRMDLILRRWIWSDDATPLIPE